MKVKPPVLRFEGTDSVTLNYDVAGGTTQIDDGKVKPLPAGLSIQLTTRLSNVSGTVDSANQFTEDKDSNGRPASIKPPKYKVVLNPAQRQAAQCVFIDMTNVTASVKPQPGSTQMAEREAKALNATCDQIRFYFQNAKETKYYLAGVSNAYASEKDAHVLRPVSFNFSIVGAETNEAALCMWIEVSGGARNGAEQSGASSVTFHPKEHDRNPLPVGSTASVILSHDIIWSQFLKPNLDKIFLELKADTHTKTDAFKANGQLNAAKYKREAVNDVDMSDMRVSRTKHCDEISFSPKEPASNISIHRGIAKSTDTAATIAYQSPEQTVAWGWSVTYNFVENGSSAGGGTVYLTYSWGAKGHWTSSAEGKHPNSISLSWEGDPHWTIKGRAKERDGWSKFLQGMKGVSAVDAVPPSLVKQDIPAPTVDLHMNSLDYFLTTNLLCPGKHTFKAHAVGKDDSRGLAVPHDLILTGDIDTSISK